MVLTDPMQVTFTIGGWAAGGTDEFGCRWSVLTNTLFYGTAQKTHANERPFGIGGYRSRSYAAGRSFTLQGWCMPMADPSWPLLVAARDRLVSVLADGGSGLLVVDDGVSPRQLTIGRDEGAPKWEVWDANAGADWGLDFYAEDPRFLSLVERTAQASLSNAAADGLDWGNGGLDWANGGLDWGASAVNNVLSMTNTGTAPEWPVLTITTASAASDLAFTDLATGRVLGYTGSIVAGQTLRIDCSPFTTSPAALDGIDRTGALTSADFIEIPPGATRSVQFSGVGDATVVATWHDAYN
ncbi:phage distal tail protein [Amycolatopsis sp. NPDC001319]|uniref:phage distal tail protein n=1 Tax=unclassified Amycolatopsis TaxID=2618356 RepID=UPI00369B334D